MLGPYRENCYKAPVIKEASTLKKLACKLGFHDLYWKTYNNEYVSQKRKENKLYTAARQLKWRDFYKVQNIDTLCFICRRTFKTDAHAYDRRRLVHFIGTDTWDNLKIGYYSWE